MSKTLVLFLMGALLPLEIYAETLEQRGLAIAQEADRRDQGFGNNVAAVQMILKNKLGEASQRDLEIRALEVGEQTDGDKSFIRFFNPPDVQGTALLTYTHIIEADDQWLYLPSLRRVKRIASTNKSGPFVSSEFAYEDMTSPEVAKYTYRYLRDDPCGDLRCFVMERYPVYENSGYSRQVVWIDQDEYRFQKVEFYDRKNALLKTLTLKGYRQYLGKHWRPDNMFMENHQTGKTTQLVWSNYRFRTGLSKEDFSQNALLRN
jgi:hypothetical protein